MEYEAVVGNYVVRRHPGVPYDAPVLRTSEQSRGQIRILGPTMLTGGRMFL